MDRFWSKVVPRESGCWEWAGARNKDGYGRFQYRGRNQRAHRVAYELACGPISAADLLVCHRCDNPPCVNPSHLFLGTKSDNAIDMIQKGRHWIVKDPSRRATGAKAHLAKLTTSQVDSIFRLRGAGFLQREIAENVGTSQQQVSRILAGRCWRNFAKAG